MFNTKWASEWTIALLRIELSSNSIFVTTVAEVPSSFAEEESVAAAVHALVVDVLLAMLPALGLALAHLLACACATDVVLWLVFILWEEEIVTTGIQATVVRLLALMAHVESKLGHGKLLKVSVEDITALKDPWVSIEAFTPSNLFCFFLNLCSQGLYFFKKRY